MAAVRRALAVTILVGACSCGPSSAPCDPLDAAVVATPDPAGTLAIGGQSVGIRASVGRDVSPKLFPSFPHGIGVSVRLNAIDRTTLPDVTPACVRVERGTDAWQTRLGEAPSGRDTDQQGRATLDASAGDGPTWGTRVRLKVWLRTSGNLTAVDMGEVTVQQAQ
jgi:hypothetical protein